MKASVPSSKKSGAWWVAVPFAALVAVLTAPFLVTYGSPELLARRATLVSARTHVWLITISAQAALWVFILAWLASFRRSLRINSSIPVRVVVSHAVLPVLAFLVPLALLTYAGQPKEQAPPTNIGLYAPSLAHAVVWRHGSAGGRHMRLHYVLDSSGLGRTHAQFTARGSNPRSHHLTHFL